MLRLSSYLEYNLMVRRSPSPHSFAQSIHLTWKKAIEQYPVPLVIKVGLKSDAIAIRHKLYGLRKSLVDAGYAMGREAQKLVVRILYSESEGNYYLQIAEPETKYDQILADAGIHLEDAPSIGVIQAETAEERDPDEYILGPKKGKGAK